MTNEEPVKRIDKCAYPNCACDTVIMCTTAYNSLKRIAELTEENVRLEKELQQARDAIPVWRSVKTDGLPEPGQRVACLRSNGSWDRGEYACLGSECLGEWYMPEGPVPCARWSPEEKVITHWMPFPIPPADEADQ